MPNIDWISDVARPVREGPEAAGRAFRDLPDDLSPGAKQVARLTAWRSWQSYALDPIMRDLEFLSKLEDWECEFLVADKVGFNWRTAPWRRYASFRDFYTKELEATYGKWDLLIDEWQKRVSGEQTLDQTVAGPTGGHHD
jgi:hypothetical protein